MLDYWQEHDDEENEIRKIPKKKKKKKKDKFVCVSLENIPYSLEKKIRGIFQKIDTGARMKVSNIAAAKTQPKNPCILPSPRKTIEKLPLMPPKTVKPRSITRSLRGKRSRAAPLSLIKNMKEATIQRSTFASNFTTSSGHKESSGGCSIFQGSSSAPDKSRVIGKVPETKVSPTSPSKIIPGKAKQINKQKTSPKQKHNLKF